MRVSKYLWKLRLAKQTNIAELCFQSFVSGLGQIVLPMLSEELWGSGGKLTIQLPIDVCSPCNLSPFCLPQKISPHFPLPEAGESLCRFLGGSPQICRRVSWHTLDTARPEASVPVPVPVHCLVPWHVASWVIGFDAGTRGESSIR